MMNGKAVHLYGIICCLFLVAIFYKVDRESYTSTIAAVSSSISGGSELLGRIGQLKRRSLEDVDEQNPRPKFSSGLEKLKTTKIEVSTKTSKPLPVDKSCECVSSKTGKSYDFCYRNPKNTTLIGKRFDCQYVSTLEDLKLLDSSEHNLVDIRAPERDKKDVMFVSGISSNHFGNFKKMFDLVKTHWPQQKMLLYSLDLSPTQIQKLEMEPNIKVRKFDYSKYPKYVENWAEYRFKALILAEAIREFPNVWWTDAHNRWLEPKPMGQFYGEIAKCFDDVDCDKKSSVMMLVNATHSNYAVLTEGLLDYFPTYGLDTLKYNDKGLQLSAAFVYLARTPFTLEILKWHALCALEEKCMNPPNAKLKCDIIPRWEKYAGCFRYDQSSLNLLMFNSFRNHNHYFMDVGKITRTYDHY